VGSRMESAAFRIQMRDVGFVIMKLSMGIGFTYHDLSSFPELPARGQIHTLLRSIIAGPDIIHVVNPISSGLRCHSTPF